MAKLRLSNIKNERACITAQPFFEAERVEIMISIIDYGAGNLHSVQNALSALGEESKISANPEEILAAERIILPGVGAFGDAMARLRQRGLDKTIYRAVELDKPLLGICLGLQLMFEHSEEDPGVKGLGLFEGGSVKIPKTGDIKIPHMGWNSLKMSKSSRLLADLGDEPYVYFVHSYYIQPADKSVVAAYTEYGSPLDVAVERGNTMAVQFHPEKSGEVGMKILKNFIGMC